jgi:hypothetical protein
MRGVANGRVGGLLSGEPEEDAGEMDDPEEDPGVADAVGAGTAESVIMVLLRWRGRKPSIFVFAFTLALAVLAAAFLEGPSVAADDIEAECA